MSEVTSAGIVSLFDEKISLADIRDMFGVSPEGITSPAWNVHVAPALAE